MNYLPKLAQGMVDEILEVIHQYDESVPLVMALGCLDVCKQQLLADAMEEDDE